MREAIIEKVTAPALLASGSWLKKRGFPSRKKKRTRMSG
jgi:hypothetical protein